MGEGDFYGASFLKLGDGYMPDMPDLKGEKKENNENFSIKNVFSKVNNNHTYHMGMDRTIEFEIDINTSPGCFHFEREISTKN